MKTIRFTLFFAGLLLFCDFNVRSQVTYVYDSAGNRISRSITMQTSSLRSAVAEEEEEEESTAYSEILSEMQIKIYPNPTTGLIRIEIQNLPADETADIALYQLSGKRIVSKRTSGSTEIDIIGQPPGTYLLKIVAGEEQTEWKIIKK